MGSEGYNRGGSAHGYPCYKSMVDNEYKIHGNQSY